MYEQFKECFFFYYTFIGWRNTTDLVLSIAIWTQSGYIGKKGRDNSVQMYKIRVYKYVN